MNVQNRRQSQRLDSLNLLVYNAFNGCGECVATGMGRTLNVSRLGILLETNERLEAEQVVAVDIGIEDNLVTVTGKIIHCTPAGEPLFHAGIRLDAMSRQAQEVLDQYLLQWKTRLA